MSLSIGECQFYVTDQYGRPSAEANINFEDFSPQITPTTQQAVGCGSSGCGGTASVSISEYQYNGTYTMTVMTPSICTAAGQPPGNGSQTFVLTALAVGDCQFYALDVFNNFSSVADVQFVQGP